MDTRYLSRPRSHNKGQDKVLELEESTRSQGMPRERRRMDHKHKDLGVTSLGMFREWQEPMGLGQSTCGNVGGDRRGGGQCEGAGRPE